MVQKQVLSSEEPLRIVAIGGGNGLSTLLRGLKDYTHLPWYQSGRKLLPPVDITAVVTVTDDGGIAEGCAASSMCFRPETSETAWLHCPKMRLCFRSCSSTGFQRGAG